MARLSEWTRPDGLATLFSTLVPVEGDDRVRLWSDLVARATAADTLALVHEEIDGEDGAGEVVTDFFQIWDGLRAEVAGGVETAAEVASGLAAHFEHLTTDQLAGLTDAAAETAAELRVEELAEAGELPTDPEPERPATPEDQAVAQASLALRQATQAGMSRASGVAGDLGVDPLAVTAHARAVAGSLVPIPGLTQLVPEMAVISLAASAGMRIRNGEPVADVKQWLVGELSTMGVANAAMVAVQLLSGLVVLRPLAVLGAKWGRARADTSAQATVAVRAARARLAPLLS